jgi:hypothetical protein
MCEIYPPPDWLIVIKLMIGLLSDVHEHPRELLARTSQSPSMDFRKHLVALAFKMHCRCTDRIQTAAILVYGTNFGFFSLSSFPPTLASFFTLKLSFLLPLLSCCFVFRLGWLLAQVT